jgi:hypothetical protein
VGNRLGLALVIFVAAAVTLAACGGSGSTASAPSAASSTTGATSQPAPTTTVAASGPGALQAEAKSAATGDIPDNQVFLTFRSAAAGWSMKYPEGWAQSGSGERLTFRDKNNIVRIVILSAPPPTAVSIRSELASLKGVRVVSGPKAVQVHGLPAFKVVYTTASAPNPVTGKRVTLQVDRYYLSNAGKEAIVDLGTPKGVDNIDAYRLMIESFRWR